MQGLTALLALLCWAVVFVTLTEGATFWGTTAPENVYGQLVFYCEYKGLRLLGKSKFKDYDDCVMCTCDMGGNLNCQNIGMRITGVPDNSECMPVNVGCRPRWVRRNDPTKKCPRNRIPPHGGVGK